jgi:hypothetical protein
VAFGLHATLRSGKGNSAADTFYAVWHAAQLLRCLIFRLYNLDFMNLSVALLTCVKQHKFVNQETIIISCYITNTY